MFKRHVKNLWLCLFGAGLLVFNSVLFADQDAVNPPMVQPGEIKPIAPEVPPQTPPQIPPTPTPTPAIAAPEVVAPVANPIVTPQPILEKPQMGDMCAPGCMPEGADESNAPVCKAGCVSRPPSKAKIQYGTGEFINKEAAERIPTTDESSGAATFNFENEAIQVVVKTILGDLLQQNYVISPDVGGTVTFATPRPINSEQAMAVLEMLLSWNNATMVRKEGRYIVLPIARAIPGNLAPRTIKPKAGDGYQVIAVPLKYISATAMQELLKPYAKPEAVVRADNARAMLILAGIASDLRTYMDTIEIFDVDWLKGMSVGIYPLERIEAKEVIPELEKIFGDSGPTPLAGMFRFMPIERLNAVMVITPQPEYLDTAQDWLAKLDRGGADAGSQLFVYYVQNVKATDLADNLTEIFGGGGGGGTKRSAPSTPSGGVTPGIESVEIRSINDPKRQSETANKTGRNNPNSSGISVIESESIRITAIEESNSLLIKATPGEYDSIERAIKRLDTIPYQVHIEAKILQVDLSGEFKFGVKWFFESDQSAVDRAFRPAEDLPLRNGLNRVIGTLGDGTGTDKGGLNQWTFLRDQALAMVDAMQSNGKTKVLAAPSIIVLNNKEASINVGQQIPVNSVSFSGGLNTGNPDGLNNAFNTTQFRDTGIILSVKPRVNPGGLVYLEIKQENSQPSADGPSSNGNPSVNKTTLETEIAVQSGQTVMLGGLIKDSDEKSRGGLPGLSKIPLIGALFGSTKNVSARQEVLLMITPTVIENAQQANDVTEDYKLRFKGLKPLLKKIDREQVRIEKLHDKRISDIAEAEEDARIKSEKLVAKQAKKLADAKTKEAEKIEKAQRLEQAKKFDDAAVIKSDKQ